MSSGQLDDSDLDAWSTPYGQSILAPEVTFYSVQPCLPKPTTQPQLSQAALALMPKNRRIQQDVTKGLFSWPRECREALYLAVIHPYCSLPRTDPAHYNSRKGSCDYKFDHKKAMKLMVLCSQVWEEAIEIVHLAENVLCVSGEEGPIFRHPKDFGKPGFFQTSVRSTMLEIPPFLSEGQILRMRKLAIRISYPDHKDWKYRGGYIKKLKAEVSAIFTALRKNPYLQQVRVILDREDNRTWWGEFQNDFLADQHSPMRSLLKPLIDMARERGIKVRAERNHQHAKISVFDGSIGEAEGVDPLVTWFNNAAISPEMKADFPTLYNQETDEMLENNLGRCKNSEMPYELVPECRNCLQGFGNWEELAVHLKKQPKHRMRFRYKKWNELHRFADQCGPRKCPTCAKSFVGIARLDYHMDEEGHYRSTIVPRYTCDNNTYERRAQQEARRKADKEQHSRECDGCDRCGRDGTGGKGGRGGRGGQGG